MWWIWILAAVVTAAAAVFWLRFRHGVKPREHTIPAISSVRDEWLEPPIVLQSDVIRALRDSLTFEDFVNPAVRAERIRASAVAAVKAAAMRQGLDLGSVALQMNEIQPGRFLVVFNDSGYALLQQADGTFKAVSQNALGQFHELGNIDPFATFLNKLAGGTAVIISIAHMISAADLARSMAKLLDKMDLLLALRTVDQYEAMRTLFDRLFVVLSRDPIDWSAVDTLTLEVAKLRNQQVGEAEERAGRWRPLVPKRGWGFLGDWREALDARAINKDSAGYLERRAEYEEIALLACRSEACWHLELMCASLNGEAHEPQQQRGTYARRLDQLGTALHGIEADLRMPDSQWSAFVIGSGNSIADHKAPSWVSERR